MLLDFGFCTKSLIVWPPNVLTRWMSSWKMKTTRMSEGMMGELRPLYAYAECVVDQAGGNLLLPNGG